jgi:Ran GTPase-activating protein (RanGAP) involved in mRNA processing and transport
VAQGENFNVITSHLMNCKSLESLDFQCNGLGDKHQGDLAKIVCAQYELKDVLRWKLNLRSPQELNVSRLGIKCLILSRNNFSDHFAEHFAVCLKADEYLKTLDLKKNNIGI